MQRPPRVVLVTRPTEYELLLARHATRGQAEFFLSQRGQRIEVAEERHALQQVALARVAQAVPADWRKNRITRADLDRFLFEPDDIVIAVGQDGLVANVAKYLRGQPVIGVNPDPARYDGVLVRCSVEQAAALLVPTAHRDVALDERTLAEARLDDGQTLLALNEIFVGHRTHQSARYRLMHGHAQERHSSSGLIVTTGTGATGWARSIVRQRNADVQLPAPGDGRLTFLVREAFPSVATGTDLTEGVIEPGASLSVTSEMNEDGVIFGDGIEADRVEFGYGMTVEVRAAATTLQLVGGG